MDKEQELGRVEANGLRFAYLEQGDGPLVLLLHGFPDTPHSYRPAMEALAGAGYRAVAPFLRGYPPTEIPEQRNVGVEAIGRDAVALIAALGHSSAIVVGHDWGSAAAYYAAAAAPEQVTKLVAIGMPHISTLRPSLRGLWVGRHFLYLRMPFANSLMKRRDLAHVDVLYRRWSPTWRFGPEETAQVKKCFADSDGLDTALRYYRTVRPGQVPAPLRGKIKVDAMVFAGLDDPGFPVSDYERARFKFEAGYEVVALPGGHFVHRESSDAFIEHLLRFVGTAEPQTAGAAEQADTD